MPKQVLNVRPDYWWISDPLRLAAKALATLTNDWLKHERQVPLTQLIASLEANLGGEKGTGSEMGRMPAHSWDD